MDTLSVRCNHCGAPLQVSDATRFVTCQFCHSSLEVKRTESSIFTEEVARIAENTGKMAETLEVIALQNEIEKLDRERGLATSLDAKKAAAAGSAGKIMGTMFGVFFTVVCILMATGFSKAGAGIFTIVPLGMSVFGIVFTLVALRSGVNENTAHSTYQERRGALERQLEVLKQK
ncbi:hypothetical protein [Prosthecobacter sp.]|uniref:hypothetical protein n=1 Tax=Prosthecobacter sp. TaxID=1965333 RepID=UPI003783D033